jgi:hypothetical protein
LHQVGSEEEASSRVLNSSTHFNKILQNGLSGSRLVSDATSTDGTEEVEPREDIASMLYQRVEVLQGAALGAFFFEVEFQVSEEVGDGDVELVIAIGGEQGGSEFA